MRQAGLAVARSRGKDGDQPEAEKLQDTPFAESPPVQSCASRSTVVFFGSDHRLVASSRVVSNNPPIACQNLPERNLFNIPDSHALFVGALGNLVW
jgi:hypothetical protein